jgi:GWxTD domain-containing protein
MPLSLYHPEVAIRNLAFIEDRKTIRLLLKGTREEQEAHIRAYWKERDPTPATEVNELMAEYYRRVDLAASRFRTGKYPVPDGLETDQARVYIVHGEPDDVERTFPDGGGVEEVWAYADGRRFHFWAPTSLDALELQEDAAHH